MSDYLCSWQLQECLKPDCMRKVKKGTDYCCTPCRLAAEGKYEIHEHSEGCDERHALRQGGAW